MANEISIAELLRGKSTLIKNKEFNATKNYVEPFLDRMAAFTNDFRIQVKLPDQMTTTLDKSTDITYNRVLIQAVLPEKYSIDSHDEVIGFLYGIDVKKPVVKIYKGYINSACTNLCLFNPSWVDIQELIPGEPINYKSINQLLETTNDFAVKLKKLKETYIDRELQIKELGKWVDFSLRDYQDYGFGKVQIASSIPIKAYKQLFLNSDSEYFIPQGVDPSLFDIYNSFTQVLTDDKKDILNSAEKTLLISKLLCPELVSFN